MVDSVKFAPKDEDEMEDFHDYDDEEQTELGSKLDDYSDAEDEDEDEDEELFTTPSSTAAIGSVQ